jgi:hypothetical protein
MDLHKLINETMKIHEEYRSEDQEAGQEPAVSPETSEVTPEIDQGLEGTPEVNQAPEITPELIEQLAIEIPELKDVDQEELLKGLEAEMEHFDTVGGDMNIVAKITLDHINEFPGQSYYTALEQLESELSNAEGQGVVEEPITEPTPEPEVSTEEPVEEPMAVESKTTEAKVSEETVAMGKAAIAKETKMAEEEVDKGKAANEPVK